MLRYQDIAENETKLLALSGLTPAEFEHLVSHVATSFADALQARTAEGFDRIGHAHTPYRNSPLPTLEDKLLFILVYLKQYPTQTVQGQLFGLSQSNANKWIHLLHPVLNHVLALGGHLPQRTAALGDTPDSVWGGEARRAVPFFHDGTERPINHPCDAHEQHLYFSGKKKCHTLKNLVLIAANCQICVLSATYDGRWHDKSLADDEAYVLPPASLLYQDLGFQGFTVVNVEIRQPHKKPRGRDLTPEAKAEKRHLAQLRIRIEHVISSIKRCRIVKDKLRLWREHIHDRVMETCCGLHNLRLQFRPWSYSVPHEP